MTGKFTPGPWNIHRSYPVDSAVRTVASEDGFPSFDAWSASVASGDTIIAEVQMRTPTGGWPHIEDVEEARANATLIVAAPEMYKALKRIIADLPIRRDWLDPVTEMMARAALAKADGKQVANG